ncbi:MAG: FMN-binding glutamate synthase family protein [Gammaproteobacteria bacterium]|nr:FMN-binding glutamate synthase family protein [Gammaproteobacteria bacterium]
MNKNFIFIGLASLVIVLLLAWLWGPAIHLLWIVVPLIVLGVRDSLQTEHTLLKNFPVIGRGRWYMETLRPFMRQYFVESDTHAEPIRRQYRTLVHNRSQNVQDTIPFGSKVNMYAIGYEWIPHSIAALDASEIDPQIRVKVGGPDCHKPYHSSILNISGMSYGAISPNAVRALNQGARLGGFAHNTGEGSITPYHLEGGGDLIWQIGTGYFGCRTEDGRFDPGKFREKSLLDRVKMIEIKLSQGAKPGHGGLLPASKNNAEVAEIRGVTAHTTVHSPSMHSTFNSPLQLMQFIKQLRELSEGKPIGFKLCIGKRSEFLALCKAMNKTGIKPDFITVDGGEGGTGAAPLEYCDSIGMPLIEALAFATDCLTGFNLKKDIKVIASGKVFNAAHVVKNLSLGADICHSARGMMFALGCVQALQCNKNTCPTGIATQDPNLYRALDVANKKERIKNFHNETLKNVVEILSAIGIRHTAELNRVNVYRRVSETEIKRFDEIYPYVKEGELLTPPYPTRYEPEMVQARAERF